MTEQQKIERAEEDTVAFTVEDGIAWVKFNRPEKRNCMSPKLNRQMKKVLEELEFREDVKVLVLTGEGDAWTAGMDLKEYFRETEAQGLQGTRGAQRDGQADAARATRDEKRFALQTAHVPHSSVCNEPLVCRADAEFTRP